MSAASALPACCKRARLAPRRHPTRRGYAVLGQTILSACLFNLAADPDELHNLAADANSQRELVRLRDVQRQISAELGDPIQDFYSPDRFP